MPGGSKQTTTTNTSATPYGPAQGGIDDIISRLKTKIPGSELTGNETGALDSLEANAKAGNPYADKIGLLADKLLDGGGATAEAGNIRDELAAYKGVLDPYANGSMIGNNPQIKGLLDTIANDTQSRVNGMFAGAGRSLSGANQATLARSLAEGTAPILFQQYNTDVDRQLNAANARYGAGNQTYGLLTDLGQTDLANRQAGVGAAASALANRDAAANQLLSVEQMRRQLPIENYKGLLDLIAPVGQAFQSTSSVQTTEKKEDPTKAIIGGAISALGLLSGNPMAMMGFGGLGMGLGGGGAGVNPTSAAGQSYYPRFDSSGYFSPGRA